MVNVIFPINPSQDAKEGPDYPYSLFMSGITCLLTLWGKVGTKYLLVRLTYLLVRERYRYRSRSGNHSGINLSNRSGEFTLLG